MASSWLVYLVPFGIILIVYGCCKFVHWTICAKIPSGGPPRDLWAEITGNGAAPATPARMRRMISRQDELGIPITDSRNEIAPPPYWAVKDATSISFIDEGLPSYEEAMQEYGLANPVAGTGDSPVIVSSNST